MSKQDNIIFGAQSFRHTGGILFTTAGGRPVGVEDGY
jgi:hypothetical protein